MKDYLGNELKERDFVITIVNIDGGYGGQCFVKARIARITRTRIYLDDWLTNDEALWKSYTIPEKCIKWDALGIYDEGRSKTRY